MKTQTHDTQNKMTRGDVTREALLRAAVEVFAREGFHAAGMRTLSQASGVNQALIGYHFGNKEGLYLAVFEHITTHMQEHIGPLAAEMNAALDAAGEKMASAKRHDLCLSHLTRLADAILSMMLSQETEQWAQLIVREHQSPTAAFTVLYDGFLGRTLGLLTRLVQGANRNLGEPDARLLVVGILGQVMVWRIARTGVMRHMGWSEMGARELEIARQAVHRNVLALVSGQGA